MFQSTHPRGVRLASAINVLRVDMFQSTHPRGVRPLFVVNSSPSGMFQSTHPRGVRQKLAVVEEPLIGFNPRTHEGCDKVFSSKPVTQSVSIHAPTRGATRFKRYQQKRIQFQSTHPRGVRQNHVPILYAPDLFQSTHPRGVRHQVQFQVGL